jgi:predicted dehydrogenase
MIANDRVRIGQIGIGYWGPNLLRSFLALPDARVTWVADLDSGRLQDAKRNGVEFHTTSDYQDILRAGNVDAVVIATPAAIHYQMAREALQAGKHVLVEKPLAMTTLECEKLIELAEQQQRVLMVGHTFLYNAAVRRLKEYVDARELGDVLYLYAQRLNLGRVRRDVNALWNFGPHDVSIILYVLGEEPVEVSARGFDYLQRGIADVVFMTLVFPSRVAAHVHISWLDPQKVRRMTVVGSRKMLVYDDVSSDAKLVLYDRGVDRVPTSESPRDFGSFAEFQLLLRSGDVTIPSLKFPEPLRLECAHFVECIRTGQRPLTDGRHGLSVVKVLEATQRSLDNNGAPVRVE